MSLISSKNTFLLFAALVIAFRGLLASAEDDESVFMAYDNNEYVEIESGSAPDPSSEESFFSPISISLSQTFGKSLGIPGPSNILEAQMFIPIDVKNLYPFIDLKVSRFFDNTYTFNEGIGLRYVLEGSKSILGVNLYHDFQSTKFNNFNQVGLGFEVIGSRLAVRVNGYLPVGKDVGSYDSPSLFDQYVGGYFAVMQQYETSFKGIDAEAEIIFLKMNSFRLSAAAGPYYYKHKLKNGKDIQGGRAFLRTYFGKYVYFKVEATRDNVYGTQVSAQLSLTVPFSSSFWNGNSSLPPSGLFQHTRRNPAIVRDKYCCWFWNW